VPSSASGVPWALNFSISSVYSCEVGERGVWSGKGVLERRKAGWVRAARE
jgi:hypothetical protein